MHSDIIYLFIGFVFGCAFMLNRRNHDIEQTYEQVDEKLRTEHAMYKNLCESLKADVAFLKQRIRTLTESK